LLALVNIPLSLTLVTGVCVASYLGASWPVLFVEFQERTSSGAWLRVLDRKGFHGGS